MGLYSYKCQMLQNGRKPAVFVSVFVAVLTVSNWRSSCDALMTAPQSNWTSSTSVNIYSTCLFAGGAHCMFGVDIYTVCKLWSTRCVFVCVSALGLSVMMCICMHCMCMHAHWSGLYFGHTHWIWFLFNWSKKKQDNNNLLIVTTLLQNICLFISLHITTCFFIL